MKEIMFRAVERPLTILLVSCALFALGCGDKLDPTEPEGAYNVFRDALFRGDSQMIWDRMAPSSHQYFDDEVERLRKMDEKIGRYLPATDHKLARKQAGSILTDEITDGRGLFNKIFQPAKLPQDEKFHVGSDVEEVQISEDEKTAKVITRGKQNILLVHNEKNDEWYIMFVESIDELGTSMKWLESNESALTQTVEDLIDEERRERESVISELMGY